MYRLQLHACVPDPSTQLPSTTSFHACHYAWIDCVHLCSTLHVFLEFIRNHHDYNYVHTFQWMIMDQSSPTPVKIAGIGRETWKTIPAKKVHMKDVVTD